MQAGGGSGPASTAAVATVSSEPRSHASAEQRGRVWVRVDLIARTAGRISCCIGGFIAGGIGFFVSRNVLLSVEIERAFVIFMHSSNAAGYAFMALYFGRLLHSRAATSTRSDRRPHDGQRSSGTRRATSFASSARGSSNCEVELPTPRSPGVVAKVLSKASSLSRSSSGVEERASLTKSASAEMAREGCAMEDVAAVSQHPDAHGAADVGDSTSRV